jgi:hypothetical protein
MESAACICECDGTAQKEEGECSKVCRLHLSKGVGGGERKERGSRRAM